MTWDSFVNMPCSFLPLTVISIGRRSDIWPFLDLIFTLLRSTVKVRAFSISDGSDCRSASGSASSSLRYSVSARISREMMPLMRRTSSRSGCCAPAASGTAEKYFSACSAALEYAFISVCSFSASSSGGSPCRSGLLSSFICSSSARMAARYG